MLRIHHVLTAVAAAALAIATAGFANASSLSGSQVTITSTFDGGAPESQTVTVGANEDRGASIELSGSSAGAFSWMLPGDYFDFAENPADPSFKEIRLIFDESHTFTSADDLKLTFQLDPAYTITNSALGNYIDVWEGDGAVVTASSVSIDLVKLDQIGDNGQSQSKAVVILQLDGPDGMGSAVPEPGTIGLALMGGAALLLRRRRRV